MRINLLLRKNRRRGATILPGGSYGSYMMAGAALAAVFAATGIGIPAAAGVMIGFGVLAGLLSATIILLPVAIPVL